MAPPTRLLLSCSLLLAAGLACGPPEEEDSAEPEEDTIPDYEERTCDVAEIRTSGPEPAHVGDTWTAFLWCDDVLMTGAQVIQFDPAEFGSVGDNNQVTFLQAGTGTLMIQAGRFSGELDITVEE